MTESTGEPAGLPSPEDRRLLREAADLTCEQVAERLGVSGAAVRSWEAGRTHPRGRKRAAYVRLLARGADGSGGGSGPGPVRDPAADGPSRPPGAGPVAGPPAPGDSAAGPPARPPRRPAARPAPVRRPGRTGPAPGLAGSEAAAPAPGPHTAPAGPTAEPGPYGAPVGPARAGAHAPRVGPVPERGPYGAPESPGQDAEAGAAADPEASTAVPYGAPEGPVPDGPLPLGARTAAEPAAPAPVPYGAPVDPTAGQGPGGAPAGGAAGDGSCSGAGGPAGLLPNPASEDPPAADPADELPEAADPGPVDGPRAAFDALYRRSATALARQAYLLTGNRGLALEAVERAFQQAWARWPEVATDPDPVGWVRAAAHEYALSPWHRFRRAHRHPEPPAGSVDPADRVLMDAVLALPPVHRRTVLLYHAVGLDLPDTAAETEATTPTAGHRLLYAHEDLACRVPAVAAAPPQERAALLHERLGALRPPVRLVPRPAAVVRGAAEYRARRWSRTVAGVTALLTAATAYTLATAPTRYEPPVHPGTSVSGVPPLSGPQRLTEQGRQLQEKLRADPAARPDRLEPLPG
ncbi:helix-turn-helix domain-containing protein [Streptomyces globosus]|uniref:helix-turn-helix domain-containing protein n=1 Tax=Streptomyces globosus TaxID=68209 RepID=UPI00362E4715